MMLILCEAEGGREKVSSDKLQDKNKIVRRHKRQPLGAQLENKIEISIRIPDIETFCCLRYFTTWLNSHILDPRDMTNNWWKALKRIFLHIKKTSEVFQLETNSIICMKRQSKLLPALRYYIQNSFSISCHEHVGSGEVSFHFIPNFMPSMLISSNAKSYAISRIRKKCA